MGKFTGMTEMDDETDWVARSRAGDPDGFEPLVRCYQRMIHTLTYRMTGSLADADDLAQETFIRAYHQMPRFRGESKFSSWLYRIAVNLCLEWRAREARRSRVQHDWAESDQTDRQSPISDPRSDGIQTALMELSPKQRAVIVLTVYEEMSHAEAAAILGCREATVSWHAFAARRRLAQLMEGSVP